MPIVLTICAFYWIVMAFTIKTRNFSSTFVFKVLPFCCGIATFLCAMDGFGWVQIF